MKTKLVVLTLFALVLALPVSNLLGLSGENEPIAVIEGSSPHFTKVTEIFQNKCVDCKEVPWLFFLYDNQISSNKSKYRTSAAL